MSAKVSDVATRADGTTGVAADVGLAYAGTTQTQSNTPAAGPIAYTPGLQAGSSGVAAAIAVHHRPGSMAA
jgi:hypothetical protein